MSRLGKFVTGDKALMKTFQALRQSVQTRIVRSAQRTALSDLAKSMKSSLPGRYKAARQGIGHSLRKGRGYKVEGKAGVAVGIRGSRRDKLAAKNAAKSAARSSGGVGISAQNLHWFIMGTTYRFTKQGGYRGAMPFDPAVRDFIKSTWSANRAKFVATVETRVRHLVEAETVKLASKAGQP